MAFDFLTKLSISDWKKSASDGNSPTCKRKASEGGIDNVVTKRMSLSIPASPMGSSGKGRDSPIPSASSSDHRAPYGLWPSSMKPHATEPAVRKGTKQPSLSEPEIEGKGKGKSKCQSVASSAVSEELVRKLEQLRLGTEPRKDDGEGSSRSQSKLPVRRVSQKKQEYYSHGKPLPDVRISLRQRATRVRPTPTPKTQPSTAAASRMPSIQESLPVASTDVERFNQSFSPTPVRSVSEPHVSAMIAKGQAGPSKQPTRLPATQQAALIERSKVAPLLAPVAVHAAPSEAPSLTSFTTDPTSRPASDDESVFDIPELMTIGTTPNTTTTSAPSSMKQKEI
ncbi:hypothetical protein LTR95_016425 [Oleoguttula sp. CCFEE 5521]